MERVGQYQFSTLVNIADNDIFDIENHKVVKQINSTRSPFCLHPVVIVADPFFFCV